MCRARSSATASSIAGTCTKTFAGAWKTRASVVVFCLLTCPAIRACLCALHSVLPGGERANGQMALLALVTILSRFCAASFALGHREEALIVAQAAEPLVDLLAKHTNSAQSHLSRVKLAPVAWVRDTSIAVQTCATALHMRALVATSVEDAIFYAKAALHEVQSCVQVVRAIKVSGPVDSHLKELAAKETMFGALVGSLLSGETLLKGSFLKFFNEVLAFASPLVDATAPPAVLRDASTTAAPRVLQMVITMRDYVHLFGRPGCRRNLPLSLSSFLHAVSMLFAASVRINDAVPVESDHGWTAIGALLLRHRLAAVCALVSISSAPTMPELELIRAASFSKKVARSLSPLVSLSHSG